MKRFSIILYLLLHAVIAAEAQVSVRFFGRVSDEANRGIEAVDVTVGGTAYGTQTDSAGRYSIELVTTSQNLTLHFDLVGYTHAQTTRRVREGDLRVNMTLRDSSTTLAGVQVVEYARQTHSDNKLDADKAKVTPGANTGIEGLITSQAGVSSNNELSNQYAVRGGNFDENCVYVNHIEVYRPMLVRSGEQEGLSFVNPDMVESLTFSTGGYSVEYGDKMASVLDIQYKKPEAFEGSASASLLGATGYVGSKNGKFTQIHGVRYKSNKNLLGSLDTEGDYDPRFFDYQTYLTFSFNPKWELDFLGNISRNSYTFIPQSRTTAFGGMSNTMKLDVFYDGREEDLFRTYFGNLALKYKPSKMVELQWLTSSFYSGESETFDINGEYYLSQNGESLSMEISEGIGSFHQYARNRMHSRVANISHLGEFKQGDNRLKWGVTFQREKVDEKTNEWEMRDSAGFTPPVHTAQLASSYNLFADNSISSSRFMAYLLDGYTFRPEAGRVVLQGGLRGSYWDWNGELALSPRASVAFFPEKAGKWGFRLAGGMYYQSPFYKEVRDTFAENGNTYLRLNSEIKSPRSFQLVGGADYYFHAWNRPFKFTAELYGKYIDRLISYQVDNVRIVYSGQNDGDGYIVGTDLKVFGEFVPGTDSWLSLSLMQAKENIYADGAGYISRPTEQRYNVSMFFQDYFPGNDKFKFNLKLNWADGLPFGPPHAQRKDAVFRTPAYRRVDVGGAYVLRRSNSKLLEKPGFRNLKMLTLGLDVLNLFGINNVNSHFWAPAAGGAQYAVPNYLTGRQVNVKLLVDF